jgi:hypothetical protein
LSSEFKPVSQQNRNRCQFALPQTTAPISTSLKLVVIAVNRREIHHPDFQI